MSLASGVNVNASHVRDAEVTGNGVAISGALAAGLSGATVNMDGRVRAQVNGSLLGTVDSEGNIIGAVGDVNVTASSTVTQARTNAPALAGGIAIAIAGSLPETTVDPDVDARIGTGTEIYSDGDVNFTATTDHRAKASAVGQNGAGGVTIGLSGATAIMDATVDATVGTNSIIIGNNVTTVAGSTITTRILNVSALTDETLRSWVSMA